MKIIVEYVLFENLLINFFILKTTQFFLKEKPKFVFLNSFFGAIIALVFPMFNLSTIMSLLAKALVGSIMVCISFSFQSFKRFIYFYFAFILMTFVYGGTCSMLAQQYGQVNVLIFVAVCGLTYVLVSVFLKAYNRRKEIKNFQFSVKLHFNGNLLYEKGYFDSGNVLYDNVTNKPIILITTKVFEKLVGQSYYEFVLKNSDPKKVLKNCHYVSASSSLSQGKMLVFEIDKIEVMTKSNCVKEYEGQFVGLSFADFEKTFDSGLLLHNSLI